MLWSTSSVKRRETFLLSLILILINSFTIASPVLGFLGLLGFLWATAPGVGKAFFPNQTHWPQICVGIMLIVATFSIAGSAIYYLGDVTKIGLITLVIVVGLFSMILGRKWTPEQTENIKHKLNWRIIVPAIAILVSITAWWTAFLHTEITDAIRSPWEVVAPQSILAIAIIVFLLAFLFKQKNATVISLPLLALSLLSATVMAIVIYPLGYGFDPFIHRSTVAHILEFGTITPKPFYYIGQYALELISVHVFALPLALIDRLLVPVLASLFLSMSAYIGFSLALKGQRNVALLSLFLLPLGAFIATTPQSLAYIFTGVLLFLSLPRLLKQENATPLITLGIFTLAAVITHPLAGIPAVIYFVLVVVATATESFPTMQNAVTILGSIAGAISLPLVFALQAKSNGLAINLSPEGIFNLSKLDLSFFFTNRFNSWLDLLYLAFDNMLWILIFFAIIGLIFAWKYDSVKTIHLPLIAAFIWFINFWLLSTVLEFDFLIEYERANYANRLLTLTALFLLPHVGFAFAAIEKSLQKKPKILFITFAAFVALLAMANVYGAYPRHDNYARSAGYNVSQSDQDAVWSIDKAGEDDQYVVLANQAVSAAALEAFGFKTYFKDDIFYYPIPTGGELYSIYLNMTDESPSRLHALQAMDLAGVDQVFFVVNEYWWQSEVIIEHAKLEADDWWAINDGAVTIFIYERLKNTP